MDEMVRVIDFYRGKKVFVTGHTGFKGTWLCRMLSAIGAEVTGYALMPEAESAYVVTGTDRLIRSYLGDVRSAASLFNAFLEAKPEIVIHMAAQPIVRYSYREPQYTYETNVMGTVNILECIRKTDCVKSFLNVTTDKVYKNSDEGRSFSEDEPLDGHDPYSNSKSCSELVTHSYNGSFLSGRGIAVSTARAGNVIGGGDFAPDRIIPDCVRAAREGKAITLRNPNSVRPYQHVLEPLYVYLMIAARQYEDITLSGSYNVGPDREDCITTGELADIFCREWGGISWQSIAEKNPVHEAGFLSLDCTKLKKTFGWSPMMNIDEAVRLTVEWTKAYLDGEDITDRQIGEFLSKTR